MDIFINNIQVPRTPRNGRVYSGNYYAGSLDNSASAASPTSTYPITETLSGALDGINKIFTFTYPAVPGTVQVIHNGLILNKDDYYYITFGQTIQMAEAPLASSSSTMWVNYTKQ